MSEEKTSAMASAVEIEGIVYYNMPLTVAIKFADKITSGFYVPLSEKKRVRIEHGDSDVKEVLLNYNEKGLDNLLFAVEDYYAFLRKIKKGMTGFFQKEDAELVDKKLTVTQVFHLLKKAVAYVGLPAETIELSEEVNKKVIQDLKNIPELYDVYKKFMTECQDEFLKNMFVSYICVGLIDALSWKTPGIKEKMIKACLLSDMTLCEKDFLTMTICKENKTPLPKHILNHPKDAARLLSSKSRNLLSPEMILIVEQHQELPDGSGYPNGLKSRQINQLSAVNIVARGFVNELIDSDFAYDNREKMIEDVAKKFEFPNFHAAAKALKIVLGIAKEEEPLEQKVSKKR